MSCRFLMRNAAATALPVWPFALGWCAAGLGPTAISLLWLPLLGQTGLTFGQNAVA